jgi:transcriptional regulator with XRE-family HTH domain
VAQARRRAGLTQKELADLVGVGERAVQAWELGQSHPYRRLAALERVLDVDRDSLLGGNLGRGSRATVEIHDLSSTDEPELFDRESVPSSRVDPLSPAGLERRLTAIEKRLDRLETKTR